MAGLGKVTTKRMFGEMGLYLGPQIFALIIDDEFYLKATGSLADELNALGGKQFTPGNPDGRHIAMPYWTAPISCLDDPAEMETWCRKALIALAATPVKKKPARTQRTK
ncbi:TfoX/Sxy family protein [Aestuariivirga litoralis]|uniref:TfoX/Sxy family protein n=1 Tax=Aestuariivirga litoralis TaxID=2650924 RepID=UPI0018C59D80|nr:TfoX/Sxy family protein [Aestuariivirga litoralis]